MNSAQANKIVFLSALFTFGFGFINSFSAEQRKEFGDFPSPHHVRLFVGAGVVFIILSAAADVAPRIAGPFAVLIGTTATLTQGAPVLTQLNALGAPAQPTKAKVKAPTHG